MYRRTAFDLKRIFLAQHHWQARDVTETGAAPPQIILIVLLLGSIVRISCVSPIILCCCVALLEKHQPQQQQQPLCYGQLVYAHPPNLYSPYCIQPTPMRAMRFHSSTPPQIRPEPGLQPSTMRTKRTQSVSRNIEQPASQHWPATRHPLAHSKTNEECKARR